MANKNPLEIIKRPAAYASGYENIPTKAQDRAKQLCWEYNRTAPNEKNRRRVILQELFGTCSEMTGIEPDFHCDYGFNIHMHVPVMRLIRSNAAKELAPQHLLH